MSRPICDFNFISFLKSNPYYRLYLPDNPSPFSKVQGMGTSYFIYSHIAKQVNINGSIMNSAFIPPSLRGTGIYSYVSKFNIDGVTISNLKIFINELLKL